MVSLESVKLEEKPAELLSSEMPDNSELTASKVLVGNFMDPSKDQRIDFRDQQAIDQFFNDKRGEMADSMIVVNGKE